MMIGMRPLWNLLRRTSTDGGAPRVSVSGSSRRKRTQGGARGRSMPLVVKAVDRGRAWMDDVTEEIPVIVSDVPVVKP